MTVKRRIWLCLIAAFGTVCLALGIVFTGGKSASADSLTFESEGDGFMLTDLSYGADQRFAFSATLGFQNGQAAGLTFGAADGESYWVFNIDRYENRVKLMYFAVNGGGYDVAVLLTDWFIGNDNMTDGERSKVNPKVRELSSVQLKVVISPETDGVHAEFFADNIKRFGTDTDIILAGEYLTALPQGVVYSGGSLGYNCFNAKINITDVAAGVSDYSYYTEPYRSQYHYSQYAHWNNDPNGLVYYDGYYHLYYQTHPYSNYWSDMYWGHARSTDLVHWELLPICLFPDTEADGWGPGDGYMWSGSARVYHYGDSAAVDANNWFPAGGGSGLIAFYTRDGGLQDQIIMTSDDGGITWSKRVRIPQTVIPGYTSKVDCRDPKVFPVSYGSDGKVSLWGMALSSMGTSNIWFLKSTDMLNWSFAGGFDIRKDGVSVECPDIVKITADDEQEHWVMSISARAYLVGDISYDSQSGNIIFSDLNGRNFSDYAAEEVPLQNMDYGADSYATQTWFIDDASSDYFGKTVSLSWFSGVPGRTNTVESGSLAAARKVWNGGGFTIPVEWGLRSAGNGYVLTQTPITLSSNAFGKTVAVNIANRSYSPQSANPLASVNGKSLEIQLEISNPYGAAVAIRVHEGAGEYTEVGWNQTDGYYLDRSNTSDADLALANYKRKYVSGLTGTDGVQKFYILADNGSVEAFCDDFQIPFYAVTVSSPYALGASLVTDGYITINSLKVNNIASVWRTEQSTSDETVLYVSAENLELDSVLTTSAPLTAYSTSGADVVWTVDSGDSVAISETEFGVTVTALKAGDSIIKATSGNAVKYIPVKVWNGAFDSDFTFSSDGINSGKWVITDSGLAGEQLSGDGFILAEESGGDFEYTAKFNLGTGAAAALVFRAKADMSDYLIANYDKNANIVKLWSPRGELGRADAGSVDVSSIVLSVKAYGKQVTVSIGGRTVINVTLGDAEPLSGRYGLNICATRAVFESVAIQASSYDYSGGSLSVMGALEQQIKAVYNRTAGNVRLNSAYYSVSGRKLVIDQSYFASLTAGVYTFEIIGSDTSFEIQVNVTSVPSAVVSDVTVQQGCSVSFYIGNAAITSVSVNGKTLDGSLYSVSGGTVTVFAEALRKGENIVEFSDGQTVTVTVNAVNVVNVGETNDNTVLIASVCAAGGGVIVIAAAVVLIVILVKKRGKKK